MEKLAEVLHALVDLVHHSSPANKAELHEAVDKAVTVLGDAAAVVEETAQAVEPEQAPDVPAGA